jgi:OPT family oligopeptide transporter
VPGSWFLAGFAASAVLTIALGQIFFHIAWWMGVIAVMSCFVLVLVTARAVGETNQTPQGALSKITQFTFGALDPTSTATNLMTANITAGATAHAGDLLGDLKSGHLLGADARQQLIAQLLGVVAGGLVVVPIFFLLIPNAAALGTARWPAPSAIVWRGVAEVVLHGFSALDPTARAGFAIGAVVGIVLTLLHAKLPKLRAFIPSATGVGLAFTIPAFACMSIFFGALLTLWARKLRPRLAEEFTVPIASGLIAGESLMGVLIALLTVKGWLN